MSETRDLLRQLLAEVLAGNGNGVVPAGAGAADRRRAPAVDVEPAGRRPARSSATRRRRGARVESVRLATDDDLARFVAHVLAHADAVRAGALRFTLGAGAAGGATRIERGAVTERTVNEAAKAGGKLVLGKRAVLTPLARERARALKIEIERER